MNFQESSLIKSAINEAGKILLNCHASPDADSVGSALALREYISWLGKEVRVICPHKLPSTLSFLTECYGSVEQVAFRDFNFSEFDLFIVCDSSSWSRVAGDRTVAQPKIKTIVIDHHNTNPGWGEINIVDEKFASNCELLYYVLQDFGFTPDIEMDYPDVATPLLTGIIGDTGAFRFPEADEGTFKVALELMRMADKNKIIFNLYQKIEPVSIEFWGELLKNLTIDMEAKFAWSAVDSEVYSKYHHPVGAKSELADMLFQSIEGTDFGLVIVEDEPGFVSVSIRSRTGVDVSRLAVELGGGGHRWASAARVYDKDYKNAVAEILEKARDFALNQ